MNGAYKYIYGYPSSILSYISIANTKSLLYKNRIKGVITTSETLSDDDKRKIESFFSVPVLNIYGANDGGIMSGSLDNKNFFYNGLDCYVEEVPTNFDSEKELLLTNLNSSKFPFARYKVGDIAHIVCNNIDSPFVLQSIKGRTRDTFQNKKGIKFHGSLINKLLKDLPYIEQYQLCQNKNYDIIFNIKTKEEQQVALCSEILTSRFKELLSDDSIDISVCYVHSFIFNSNSKKKLIISDVV
jgi:phenylacetate-CoA ligase